jgi:membrane-bound serine protease (ClpP class)
VRIIEAHGLLDPVLVDFIERRVEAAEREGAEVLIIQLNSPGAVVGDDRIDALLAAVRDARVPVGVWVGPSGAEARGAAARLVLEAPVSGIAPGSRIGEVDRPDSGPNGEFGARTVGAEQALEVGLVDIDAPVIGEFVVALDGREIARRTLDTAAVVGEGDDRRLQPHGVSFAQLPLQDQLMHTVASPAVAYLLLAIGLTLLVFEFYTAGVGVAGLVGAGSLVLASYGLVVLPTRWWALALVALGVFGFTVDVQTGASRFWTAVGTVALAVGSLFLFEGLSIPWLALLAGVVGVVVMMIGGMPAMVRSRFSTPTIGREAMIGELGEAAADVRPDGVVKVRDALWRATTNRATPIAAGDRVRVVGIDGLVLEVEPEEGGARDYRERARS